jgi:hypothetical protein
MNWTRRKRQFSNQHSVISIKIEENWKARIKKGVRVLEQDHESFPSIGGGNVSCYYLN